METRNLLVFLTKLTFDAGNMSYLKADGLNSAPRIREISLIILKSAGLR